MINTIRSTSFLLILAACIGFCSCSILGIPSGFNWSPGSGKKHGDIKVGTIRVDKNADWDSVEAETKRLLPLLLSQAGYGQASQKTDSLLPIIENKADVVLIEREYMKNWKTLRSLSAEVLIFECRIIPDLNDPSVLIEEKNLLAAGKALLSGKKSFSSSKVLYDLLELALSNALKAMPKR
jgi:hypothetical protein